MRITRKRYGLRRQIRTGVVAALGLLPACALAADSQSFSITLSVTVDLVCRADIDAIDPNPGAREVTVTISEFCNGGAGYTLMLDHDGAGIEAMSYDNTAVDHGDTTTTLAVREGPFRGTRRLRISTDGVHTPAIRGVSIQPVQLTALAL